MTTIIQYSTQCELAWAAYATLEVGAILPGQLTDPATSAMPDALASSIAPRYRVIDVLDSITGANAVLFENMTTGGRTLAVRGTSDSADLGADYLLTQIPPSLNPQYLALRAKVNEWQTAGFITSSTELTGYSLGGYLVL